MFLEDSILTKIACSALEVSVQPDLVASLFVLWSVTFSFHSVLFRGEIFKVSLEH